MGHSLGPGKTSPTGGDPLSSPLLEASGGAHRRSSMALPILRSETEAHGHMAAKQQEWPQLPGSTQITG